MLEDIQLELPEIFDLPELHISNEEVSIEELKVVKDILDYKELETSSDN